MLARGRLCGCLLAVTLLVAAPVRAQPRALPANEAILTSWPDNYAVVPVGATAYSASEGWSLQFLPDGLLYPAYLAGGRESRFASQWIHERGHGWLWDAALGGRVGMLRLGTSDAVRPEGWQLDIEGAVFARMDLELDRDMVGADYRFGIPMTFRHGWWEAKFGYDHISSHLGDEYMENNPQARRINFVRDCVIFGLAVRPRPDVRVYGEAGWAFNFDGGSRPWEFQFGVDYSSPDRSGILGSPFVAVNGRIRQEADFSGNVTLQAGRQWRGQSGHLLRLGAHYFNGKSEQYQFSTEHEEQLGVGMWYDY